MTELEILTLVVLPLGIALFGWLAVLVHERRSRKPDPAKQGGR